MTYHYSRTIDGFFDQTVEKIIMLLKENKFDLLTSVDLQATLKANGDVKFRPYVILGACNPGIAHQAIIVEERIGVMLPCNIVIQLNDDDTLEITAIDAVAAMKVAGNKYLDQIAEEINATLKKIIDAV